MSAPGISEATSLRSDSPHLRIDHITVRRGGRYLISNLELTIPRGRFVAVVGPSGAGKSTLLETLAGMRAPYAGAITYCSRQCGLQGPREFRRRMGLVFQQLHLTRNGTALENVLAGALVRHRWWRTLCGFPSSERALALRWLEVLGLGGLSHRLIRRLSGGEQQRVAIARAFVQDPELILADEPVSHLDSALASRVLGRFQEEVRVRARTVLCVLHDLALVDRFADAVLTLGTGGSAAWQWRIAR